MRLDALKLRPQENCIMEYSIFAALLDEPRRNAAFLCFVAGGIGTGYWTLRHTVPERPSEQARPVFPLHLLRPEVLLCGALIVGAALRFYGLTFGLPHAYHPDEWQKTHLLQDMIRRGSVNPHFTPLPPLLLYLSWGFSVILSSLELFSHPTARDLFSGRMINAVAGVWSIMLVYSCARKIFDSDWTAAFAALLIAVSPLHVTNSRYMKEDVLFLFFTLAALYFVLIAVGRNRPRWLYLAGVMCGFSCGAKYTGAASIGMLIAAPWLFRPSFRLLPEKRILPYAALAIIFAPFAFYLTLPFAWGDTAEMQHVVAGIARESKHAIYGHQGSVITGGSQLWMYHFSRSIIPGISLFTTLIALFGIGLALRRGDPRSLLLVALCFAFYLPAEAAPSKPVPQADRYVIACVPFLLMLAAEWIRVFTLSVSAVRPKAALAVTFLAAFLPFVQSVAYASEIHPDTRDRMTQWMHANLPPGSRVLTMGGAAYLPHIPLKLNKKQARKLLGTSGENIVERLRATRFDYLLISDPAPERFLVEHGSSRPERRRLARHAIDANFPIVVEKRAKFGIYGFHNPTLRLYALQSRH